MDAPYRAGVATQIDTRNLAAAKLGWGVEIFPSDSGEFSDARTVGVEISMVAACARRGVRLLKHLRRPALAEQHLARGFHRCGVYEGFV
jgi:hypothetical protein